MLLRPELGALAGAILVWMFFAVVAGPAFRSAAGTAAFLNAAAPLGILALGIPVAAPTLAAVRASDRADDIKVATFDLSPAVLEGVRDGALLFAIDQQQYLQGYLPIVLLTKYLETGALPGGGQVLLTGPGFVTRENAASVIAHSARGVR